MNTRKYLYIVAFVFLFANVSFAAKWKAKHVVLIGLDGWGAYSVEKAEMPTVKKLMAEGSYTLKKKKRAAFFQRCELGFYVYGGWS